MSIQTVIFDLDGTLLDTLDDLADSVNQVLLAHGMPTHSRASYKRFVGDGIRELVRRVLPRSNFSNDVVKSFTADVKNEYAKRWNQKTKPYPGIKGLLKTLTEMSITTGVLTNKPHEFTERMITYYFPEIFFGSIKGLRDGIPQKPDPTQIFEMIKDLRVAPEECLYLGDSDVDMMTANRAGIYAVGALWGFRDKEELLAHGAMDAVSEPSEVISIINKLSFGIRG